MTASTQDATLKFAHSGKCLDVSGISNASGANVIQWPRNTTEQNDVLTQASVPTNSVFNLVAAHSGKCIDVPGASLADGVAIDQYDRVGGAANEPFEEVPAIGGFPLKARHPESTR